MQFEMPITGCSKELGLIKVKDTTKGRITHCQLYWAAPRQGHVREEVPHLIEPHLPCLRGGASFRRREGKVNSWVRAG
jgi:hypothetical protein